MAVILTPKHARLQKHTQRVKTSSQRRWLRRRVWTRGKEIPDARTQDEMARPATRRRQIFQRWKRASQQIDTEECRKRSEKRARMPKSHGSARKSSENARHSPPLPCTKPLGLNPRRETGWHHRKSPTSTKGGWRGPMRVDDIPTGRIKQTLATRREINDAAPPRPTYKARRSKFIQIQNPRNPRKKRLRDEPNRIQPRSRRWVLL